MRKVELPTVDGMMDVYVFQPANEGKWPAVIFYMDGVGIRPELQKMAERLASHGYFVLLPNLFYRWEIKQPLSFADLIQEGPMRDLLFKLITELTIEKVMVDTKVLLDFIDQQDQVKIALMGTVGYCMGGKYAIGAAATFHERVSAAASYHGGSLATTLPGSVHLLTPNIKGKVYIGIAEIDQNFSEEQKERLLKSLQDANVNFTSEIYKGVRHGFAVNDSPAYNKEASERHWETLLDLFGEKLK
jgi:carboxymethylenebutenolidase